MTSALFQGGSGGTMAQLIGSRTEWGALGPPDAWPQSLRTVLRLMLSSRYAMWLGWGPDLLFFYNDAYREQTLGKKHPWALGRPAREVWAEVWESIGPRAESVLESGEATWDEGLLLFLERSGYREETYHTFSYSIAPGDAGESAGLFCVVIEETERVIGERRLQLLKDLATLLGAAEGTAAVIHAVEECLGGGGRELAFALLYLFDPDDRHARRVVRSGIDEHHPSAPEVIEVDSAGSPWPFREVLESREIRVLPLASAVPWPETSWGKAPAYAMILPMVAPAEDRPSGVFIVGLNPFRPVDEGTRSFNRLFVGQVASALANARAYEQEKERAEALAELDRAKTTFFSNVSHEFRTPLTLMLAPIDDLLADPSRDPDERHQLALLHRNALRLLKLVNTLLEFSRLEAGRVEAVYEPTDLAALTRDLASSFRSAVERAGIELRVECDPLREPFYVDRTMWEKIVLNLLSNALKFTFEGAITVSLQVEDGAAPDARLDVTDTGTGIPEEELPRLFERFRRIEGARSRSHEGSGIGLALVQELVRLHGGNVQVRSRVGAGTTFSVRLPSGTAHLPAGRVRADGASASSASTAEAFVEEALLWLPTSDATPSTDDLATTSTRERIVFADDNADMRAYVTRILRDHWVVECVSDGQAALDAIRKNPPDLVLADVMMPELDGFGLLRAVRSDVALRAIPVVLLSARAGEEATAEGLEAGADDYIVKPFRARDLVVRIAARLTAVRAARAANEQRQNLYRHFMQAPFPIGVFRGPQHVVELANDALLRVWGKTRAVVGCAMIEAIPELTGQPFLGLLDGVYQTGRAHEGRGELARLPTGPDGALEDWYFNYVYAPLLDPRGAVEGILLSAFDVTLQVRSAEEVQRARARAEELAATLQVTAQRLEAAQHVAGIGIFDWDVRQARAYLSAEMYALMQRAPGDLEPTADAWTEALIEEDRAVGWAAFERAVATRADAMETELRLRQPGDGSRWVRLSSRIFYDDAGKPARLIGAVVDVQVLKEAAAARAHALEEAERTGRAKDEFLATMSHELRTPLNAMLGWSRILRKDHGDEARLEKGLAVIERNAVTQTRLVSDLLDVSRIISGKLRLALQPVEVGAVLAAAIDVVRPAADAKEVELVVTVDDEAGTVVADPDRVQQIVWNLLVNAVRFTPPHGRVAVSAKRAGSAVRIVVEDNGTGIPAEHLPHIFERFRQVDASTTRAYGGLGLGLAIVRYLVEAHGGTVDARSEGRGRGATFAVTLPVRAIAAALDDDDDAPGAPSAEPRSVGPLLAGVRALVVEDDPDSLELVTEILEMAGATVVGVPGARQALEAPGAYDVVISDIGMPNVDGYELIRRLRARDTAANVPAIALTAYARGEDVAHAMRAGFHEHLAKPVDAAKLVEAVRRWTERPRR